MSCVAIQEQIALGAAVPALEAHAISVSLPTWEDNIGYEEGDKRVVDAMVSGYPRFFIHLSIRKVSTPALVQESPANFRDSLPRYVNRSSA